VGDSILVRQDGTTRHLRQPKDPYVYHHKWLFVADDYTGFDVRESKARSRAWMQLADVDRSRIGKKSYWREKVVPRLQPEE
jgi:hypothetical protein